MSRVVFTVVLPTTKGKSKTMNQTESVTYDHEGHVIERAVTTAPLPASSVEIATDSKGNPKPTVKVYHNDPAEAKRLACELYAETVVTLQTGD